MHQGANELRRRESGNLIGRLNSPDSKGTSANEVPFFVSLGARMVDCRIECSLKWLWLNIDLLTLEPFTGTTSVTSVSHFTNVMELQLLH